MALPERIESVEQLDEVLSAPTPGVVEAMERLEGDLIVLGAAGKMGPTLTRMAKRASDEAGVKRRVTAVSRFSNPEVREALEAWGVETIACDLLDDAALQALPDAPNVVYMAGMKFGSTGNEPLTWAMNVYLPGRVAEKYRASRIAAFSTGNIYGLTPAVQGGSLETGALDPHGDYAQSCLGRERMFDHFSRVNGTPTTLIRLNYACELRYGVLVDLAKQVWAGETVDLSMGCMNVIWQGDANAMSLASLEDAASPPCVLNVAGPELLSVRQICGQFAERMDKEAHFTGEEATDALISNGQLGHERYGYPRVPVRRLLSWIADWVMQDGASLGKPTHFEVRDGKF